MHISTPMATLCGNNLVKDSLVILSGAVSPLFYVLLRLGGYSTGQRKWIGKWHKGGVLISDMIRVTLRRFPPLPSSTISEYQILL